MQRRNLSSVFVGGAYVFPGGALDSSDDEAAADADAAAGGRSDADASLALGIARGGLAYWVAAIRECFEEAGVLLARHRVSGDMVDLRDPQTARRFAEHRRAVDAGERRLADVVRDEGLVLAVDSIYSFAHWITPVGAPRRYDTRFFVAAAPPNQEPEPDEREAVEGLWITPADALARHEAGDMDLIWPTVKSLEAIARFSRAGDLLAAARWVDHEPAAPGRIVPDAHGVRILLPGDRGHPGSGPLHELAEEVARLA